MAILKGRDAILFLKDIFNIKQEKIKKLTITAEVGEALMINIEAYCDIDRLPDVEKIDEKKSIYQITKIS